jgi:hypothetical protein
MKIVSFPMLFFMLVTGIFMVTATENNVDRSKRTRPWVSKSDRPNGHCRYAYSADGFNQDRDDVAGSAMTLALFDRAGIADQIVHFHFNTNFGGEPKHAEEHRKSVLQTAVLFGIIKEENGDDAFFDVSRSEKERADAISHLAKQISLSTKRKPLMMICAGGVQVPYLALKKAIENGAGKEALQSVTFLSHATANEQTASKNHENKDYHNNWDNLKLLTPGSRFIDSTSPWSMGEGKAESINPKIQQHGSKVPDRNARELLPGNGWPVMVCMWKDLVFQVRKENGCLGA